MDYEVSLIQETRDLAAVRCRALAGDIPRGESLAMRISPIAKGAWHAVFEGGPKTSDVLTRIMSCPSSEQLCVVASGQGYVVDVLEPGSCLPIDSCYPITAALPIKSSNLLVLADWTKVCAMNRLGIAWTSRSVSFDRLRDLRVDDEFLRGTGWSDPDAEWVEFSIDLATGIAVGGASFDDLFQA